MVKEAGGEVGSIRDPFSDAGDNPRDLCGLCCDAEVR